MQATRGAPLSGDNSDPSDGAGQSASPAPLARRRIGLFAAVGATVYLLDQLTKYLAVKELSGEPPRELVGTLLQLELIRNPGAAFSIGTGATAVFTVVASIVVVIVLRAARRLRSGIWALALGLLLGGALGNLTDRLFRSPRGLRGHVVDFLQLPNFPVFNVADMAVVSSAALISLLSLRGLQLDGTRAAPSRTPLPEKDRDA
jgi:signal peptidase II